MKFGIFSVVDHYPKESSRSVGRFYGELLEQAEAAEELGFDSFWLAEHHFHEYGVVPRPALLLAAAARRTRRIRLGAAVVVLPFDNPLRVAEDYAMVDILSDGRLNLGIGSGYLQHEFAGFGIAPQEKRERFDEALLILQKAWSGERFSFKGAYHTVDNLQLNVLPVQRPLPATWIAVLNNAAAPFVAQKGFPIMMIPYAATEHLDELADTVSAHRRAYTAAGFDADGLAYPFGLHTFCAADDDAARLAVQEAMERYVRTRLYARQRPFDLLVEKKLAAFGSPKEIMRVAQAYQRAGFTHFLAIMNFGALEHGAVLRSMELMAQEVLPAFAHSAPADEAAP